MSNAKPIGGRVFTKMFCICLVFVLFAAYFALKRLFLGLGEVTGMNDGFPWGLWIAYDVVVGTAFACGGYTMALLTYIFNRGHFHPLVRPALLASMFGYCLAGVSVLLDIGRYINVYNLYLPWRINPHSAMLEVALCITTYCFVMIFEFVPTFFEKWRSKHWAQVCAHIMDKFIFVLIALGVLLPTMHQSSLGTMIYLAGFKLSAIWHSPWLPMFYLLTALFMGFSMVVFEGTISSRVYKLGDETKFLAKIGRIVAVLLAVFLIARFENLYVLNALGEAFSGSFYSCSFLLETALLIGGLVLLAHPRFQNRPRSLFIAAVLTLCGGSLYRFNTYLIGYDPGTGWQYFPSVGEQMISYGMISAEIIGYMLLVKFFPVFSAGHKTAASNS